MTKKGHQFFSGKNRGVTPSVDAPGVTHPSDATDSLISYFISWAWWSHSGKFTDINPIFWHGNF